MNFTNQQSQTNDVNLNAFDPSNWIKRTKQNLKERENRLMSIRTESIQNIINQQCQLFQNTNTFESNSNCQTQFMVTVSNYQHIIATDSKLVDECLMKLYQTLDLWNGVNLNKTKAQMPTFNRYYSAAKNWFDIKKKHILTPEFWIKLFMLLENFSNIASANYFQKNHNNLRTIYSKTLLFQIIGSIFSGEILIAINKPKPLMSSAIFKDSEPMKQYLITLDSTLNIDQIVQKHTMSTSHKKKNLNATGVKELIRKQLHILVTQSQQQLHQQFQRVFGVQHSIGNLTVSKLKNNSDQNNANINSKPETIQTNVHVRPPTWEQQQQRLVIDTPILPINHIISNGSGINTNVNNGYNVVHNVSVPTSLQRYTPMNASLSQQNNFFLINNCGNYNQLCNTYNIPNVNNSGNVNVNFNHNNNDALLQFLSVYLSLM